MNSNHFVTIKWFYRRLNFLWGSPIWLIINFLWFVWRILNSHYLAFLWLIYENRLSSRILSFWKLCLWFWARRCWFWWIRIWLLSFCLILHWVEICLSWSWLDKRKLSKFSFWNDFLISLRKELALLKPYYFLSHLSLLNANSSNYFFYFDIPGRINFSKA